MAPPCGLGGSLYRMRRLPSGGIFKYDMTFAQYYAKKRREGKPHRVALTHVAKKLVRVIFALERGKMDYDPKAIR